ncbi:MAG: homocysteine biosynthesis protein [Candidatus Bathyarchaeia archaeon]
MSQEAWRCNKLERRTLAEINQKIKRGDVQVLTVEEMKALVESSDVKKAFREVDVVTTATFGPMCSSGAFLNFGHSEPPIKMERVWLNDVEAYHGNAAVDCYIGATKMSITRGFEYGGGHVIEDLVAGKEIELKAMAYGTDCYPRKILETKFTIYDLNQAILCNPRNCYQRYNAATNSTDRTLYTYMGILLPKYGNINYAGCGELNPLINDPTYRTIGIGTRIFLGGGVGYVIGEGTQHNPKEGFGTLMVKGDLKRMRPEYLRGTTFHNYGVTLYVGIGIPIPILDEEMAKSVAVKDEEIFVKIVDYGVPSRNRPAVREVSYAELKSGKVEVRGRSVKTACTSSIEMARKIMVELKKWINEGTFFLTEPVERLPRNMEYHHMKMGDV